jgi:hypothetical protein
MVGCTEGQVCYTHTAPAQHIHIQQDELGTVGRACIAGWWAATLQAASRLLMLASWGQPAPPQPPAPGATSVDCMHLLAHPPSHSGITCPCRPLSAECAHPPPCSMRGPAFSIPGKPDPSLLPRSDSPGPGAYTSAPSSAAGVPLEPGGRTLWRRGW